MFALKSFHHPAEPSN